MVAVLIMLLVMAALGATMLTSARGGRRRTNKVTANLQRELVLDAALVHGFHHLRTLALDPARSPFAHIQVATGQGKLGEISYEYQLTPEPETLSVRIDAEAGDEEKGGILGGYAVAYLKVDDTGKAVRYQWSVRYFGPESPEKQGDE